VSDGVEGGCLCGKVRYCVSGAPRFAIKCYCRDCQHVSGSGHLPQVAVTAAGFSASGPLELHHRSSDAGFAQTVAFCGACGSPIYKSTAQTSELLFLTAGSLDDPASIPPLKPVYEEGRLPWDPV